MGSGLWRDAIEALRTERGFESVKAIHVHLSIFNSKLQHTIEDTYVHSFDMKPHLVLNLVYLASASARTSCLHMCSHTFALS